MIAKIKEIFFVPGICSMINRSLRRTLVHWEVKQLLPKRRWKRILLAVLNKKANKRVMIINNLQCF